MRGKRLVCQFISERWREFRTKINKAENCAFKNHEEHSLSISGAVILVIISCLSYFVTLNALNTFVAVSMEDRFCLRNDLPIW